MNFIVVFTKIMILIFNLIFMLVYFNEFLKLYQLNGYSLSRQLSNFRYDKTHKILLGLLIFFNIFNLLTRKNFFFFAINLLLYYLLSVFFILKIKKEAKNRIVFTKRFTRFFVFFFLCIGLSSSLLIFLVDVEKISYFFVNFIFIAYLIFIFCHLFIYPLEELIKGFYIKKAKKKLMKCTNLKVIGITGSFGKTSVKNILFDLIKDDYKTVKTQGSYNTPMGFTKVILNDLSINDEILILEYGADKVHDINKLCKIIKPNYSIITGVTNQHLKTFKSLDNIISTKYELAQNTKEDGEVVFNGDNSVTLDYYYKTNKKASLVSTTRLNNSCLYAENIVVSIEGTEFDLVFGENSYHCKTKLLGKHNVLNILLAIKMAQILGLSFQKIIEKLGEVNQIPHRLSLIESGGRYILDDSFNANPKGVECALNVLKVFPKKKIVITSGLVELGEKAYEENYKLGKMLQKVDVVIIVGKINLKALKEGLRGGKNIVFYKESLGEALKTLDGIFFEKDCVLFLNDLPDNYT